MQENKLTIRGELSLLLVIIINSLGVVLMLHSGSGISAISSVPYAFADVQQSGRCFNAAFRFRHFGNFQCALRLCRCAAGYNSRRMDGGFSGFAGAQPDAFKQTLCAGVPVQLRCRLCLQRHD